MGEEFERLRGQGVLDRVAPDSKVNQDDAGMKLAFKERARPSSRRMRRTAVEDDGKATGLYSSASNLRTPGDTNPSFGPGEHGMREEEQ